MTELTDEDEVGEIKFGFNSLFLSTSLEKVETKNVLIGITDHLSPLFIIQKPSEDELPLMKNLVTVVMPMNLKE